MPGGIFVKRSYRLPVHHSSHSTYRRERIHLNVGAGTHLAEVSHAEVVVLLHFVKLLLKDDRLVLRFLVLGAVAHRADQHEAAHREARGTAQDADHDPLPVVRKPRLFYAQRTR